MIAVVFSLLSALAYGISDFLGGIFTKATSPWKVATIGQLSSTVCVAVAAPFIVGSPVAGDFGWAALAGLGSGLGGAFLYRGLARAKMSVVAPISAVGCALIPVAVGLAIGERPSMLALIGIAAAFPAIWLISRRSDNDPSHHGGIVDGVLAGIGFGVMFVALAQVDDEAGLWPITLMYAVSTTAVAIVAMATGERPLPAGRSGWAPVMLGPVGVFAVLTFWAATGHGLLSVVSVITALYPASTVLLAAMILHERVQRTQGFGLLLAALAVACVAAG